MPTATRDGRALYYETDGEGETVAFCSPVGYGAWVWGGHHDAIAGPRETLVWDYPGTGRSDAPDGSLSVDALVSDFEAVLAAAGVERAHVVGAGLGGMVTLRYARTHSRARTLTLYNTAADGNAVDADALSGLHPETDDEAALLDSFEGAFSRAFRDQRAELIDQFCAWRREDDATAEGVSTQTAAVTDFEAGPLYELTLPALVCHGVDDPVVSASVGEQLAENLPQGTYEAVEGRHLCFVEHAHAVTDRMLEYVETNG